MVPHRIHHVHTEVVHHVDRLVNAFAQFLLEEFHTHEEVNAHAEPLLLPIYVTLVGDSRIALLMQSVDLGQKFFLQAFLIHYQYATIVFVALLHLVLSHSFRVQKAQ